MGALPFKKSESIETPEADSSQQIVTRRLNRWSVRTLLFLTGVLVSLILVEVFFRAFYPTIRAEPPLNDRAQHYYLPEGLGEKPALVAVSKPANTFRVLVVGDSFTFGQGNQLADAFPAQLERRLNLNKKQPKVEVINWGVRGVSTVQEVQLVKDGLKLLKPDLVVLEITLNDPELQPYRVTHPWLDEHGRVVLKSPIFDYWRSLRFVVERILNTKTHRDYTNYYLDLYSNPETWGPFNEALRSFKSLTQESGVPTFAMIFPLFSHPLDDQYPFVTIHRKLRETLAGLKLRYIDLLGRYRGMSNERLQVEPHYDSHPNEIAHRIAADALLRALVHNHLVPVESVPKNVIPAR